MTPIAGLGSSSRKRLRTYLDLRMKINAHGADPARARRRATAPAAPLRGGAAPTASPRIIMELVGGLDAGACNLNTMRTGDGSDRHQDDRARHRRHRRGAKLDAGRLAAGVAGAGACYVLRARPATCSGQEPRRRPHPAIVPRAGARRRTLLSSPRRRPRIARHRGDLRSPPRRDPLGFIANLAAFATLPLMSGLLLVELETWNVPLDSTTFPLLVFTVFIVTNC